MKDHCNRRLTNCNAKFNELAKKAKVDLAKTHSDPSYGCRIKSQFMSIVAGLKKANCAKLAKDLKTERRGHCKNRRLEDQKACFTKFQALAKKAQVDLAKTHSDPSYACSKKLEAKSIVADLKKANCAK